MITKISTPAPRIITGTTEAIEAMRNEVEIALDIETSGLSPWNDIIAVVIMRGARSGALAVLHLRGYMPPELRDFLSEPGRLIVAHNSTGFDALFLANAGVNVFAPIWYDTLVAEGCVIKAQRRDLRVSLQATAKRRLGVELDKSIDHRTWMLPKLTEEHLRYALGDVMHLSNLRQIQLEATNGTPQSRAIETEMRLTPEVLRMSLYGLPISMDVLNGWMDELRIHRAELEAKLIGWLGPINFRSTKQVSEALKEHGYSKTSTAVDVLKDEWLTTRVEGLREILEVLMDYRSTDQPLKMYRDEWVEKHVVNGRVHGRFWQVATDTGRFSSSNPNLQQIPKSARKIFVARPGYKIVSIDYSQIEVRCAAHYANDPALSAALRAADVHTGIASQIFGIPVDQVTPDQRRLSKACSFTLLFAGGPDRLYEYSRLNGGGLSRDQAIDVFNKFFDSFQGLWLMRAKAKKMAQSPPVTIKLPTGLKRVLAGLECRPAVILNTMIQGTAAAGLKFGILEAAKRDLTKYIGAVVHDEIVCEVPEDDAEIYAASLRECMLIGMQCAIPGTPVDAEIKIADAWS